MRNIILIFISILSRVIIRKEIRDLTDQEWNSYKEAALKLYSAGFFENFCRTHKFCEEYAHDDPRFLPWHRMFLQEYESYILQVQEGSNLGVPYWDWSLDAAYPSDSFIFTPKYWGFEECFLVKYPKEHCLERNTVIEPWHNPGDIKKLLNRRCNYDEFRFMFEMVPHGLIHANIGGDMAEMYSPNDPVFWHHHAYVDYLWTKRGERYDGEDITEAKKLDKNEILYPFNRKVKTVLKQKNIKYIDYKPTKALSFRKAVPLPAEFIKKHGFNEEKIREDEQFFEKKTSWINRIFG